MPFHRQLLCWLLLSSALIVPLDRLYEAIRSGADETHPAGANCVTVCMND